MDVWAHSTASQLLLHSLSHTRIRHIPKSDANSYLKDACSCLVLNPSSSGAVGNFFIFFSSSEDRPRKEKFFLNGNLAIEEA
uniref:Uncharacterized protein n=1 Tax=Romanomermis culicivorax TaxID=13658 RepID=A0A915I0T4_ROMCU